MLKVVKTSKGVSNSPKVVVSEATPTLTSKKSRCQSCSKKRRKNA